MVVGLVHSNLSFQHSLSPFLRIGAVKLSFTETLPNVSTLPGIEPRPPVLKAGTMTIQPPRRNGVESINKCALIKDC